MAQYESGRPLLLLRLLCGREGCRRASGPGVRAGSGRDRACQAASTTNAYLRISSDHHLRLHQ